MLAARTRYLAKRYARAVAGLRLSDITQRNNADQPLVSIEDRQAPDLDVAHVRGDFLKVLVLKTIFDVGRHHVAEPGPRPMPIARTAISRSEIMPTKWSLLATGKTATPSAAIASGAS